jgi:hypothetical protein
MDIVDESLVELLPKSVTKLKLGKRRDAWVRFTPTALHNLSTTHPFLKNLSLNYFSIPQLRIGWKAHFKGLRSLSIDSCPMPPLEPCDFESLPPTLTSLMANNITKKRQKNHPSTSFTFHGKEAWIEAMSRFKDGFVSLSLKCDFLDPDILFGIKNNLVPLSSLCLVGFPTERPLTDEHLACPNLKLIQILELNGAVAYTDKALLYLPADAPSVMLPKSPFLSKAAISNLSSRTGKEYMMFLWACPPIGQ